MAQSVKCPPPTDEDLSLDTHMTRLDSVTIARMETYSICVVQNNRCLNLKTGILGVTFQIGQGPPSPSPLQEWMGVSCIPSPISEH